MQRTDVPLTSVGARGAFFLTMGTRCTEIQSAHAALVLSCSAKPSLSKEQVVVVGGIFSSGNRRWRDVSAAGGKLCGNGEEGDGSLFAAHAAQ